MFFTQILYEIHLALSCDAQFAVPFLTLFRNKNHLK